MDPDVKRLLEENLALSKENNELLKKVQRVQRWAQITRYVYWFIIIGFTFGAFYFVEPYLGSILNVYTGGTSNINSLKDVGKSIPSVNQLQDMVKGLNQ